MDDTVSTLSTQQSPVSWSVTHPLKSTPPAEPSSCCLPLLLSDDLDENLDDDLPAVDWILLSKVSLMICADPAAASISVNTVN